MNELDLSKEAFTRAKAVLENIEQAVRNEYLPETPIYVNELTTMLEREGFSSSWLDTYLNTFMKSSNSVTIEELVSCKYRFLANWIFHASVNQYQA